MAMKNPETFDIFDQHNENYSLNPANPRVTTSRHKWYAKFATDQKVVYRSNGLRLSVPPVTPFSSRYNQVSYFAHLPSEERTMLTGPYQEVLMLSSYSTSADFAFGPAIDMRTYNLVTQTASTDLEASGDNKATLQYLGAYVEDSRLVIFVRNVTSFTTLAEVPFTPPQQDERFWMRFWYEQSTHKLKFKVWTYGTEEPTNPQLEASWTQPFSGVPGYTVEKQSYTYFVNIYQVATFTDTDRATPPLPLTVQSGVKTPAGASRLTNTGWGMSEEGHLWRGTVTYDPDYYNQPDGMTTGPHEDDSEESFGDFNLYVDEPIYEHFGMIGPNVGASEVLMRRFPVRVPEDDMVLMRLGLRGATTTVSNQARFTGVWAELSVEDASGPTPEYKLAIKYRTTPGGADTTVASTTVTSLPTATDLSMWNCRFYLKGLDAKIRIWDDEDAEPATWLWEPSALSIPTNSGQAWTFWGEDSYSFDGLEVTAVESGDSATYVSTTVKHITDTSFDLDYAYTGDSDASLTASMSYREIGEFEWIPMPTPTRTTVGSTKHLISTASSLNHGQTYEFRIILTDDTDINGPTTLLGTVILTNLGSVAPTEDTFSFYDVTSNSMSISFPIGNDGDGDSSAVARIGEVGQKYGPAIACVKVDGQFQASFGSLQPETQYQVEVTITDPDGVHGTNPSTFTAKTIGNGLFLESVDIDTLTTTATVNVFFHDDLNENGTIDIQYKSAYDSVWTVVPHYLVGIDRENGLFRTTLMGLKASTSYQVQVFASDVDGLSPESPVSITADFITAGRSPDPDYRGKHFVFRVYDKDVKYLGSWTDAPDPSFSWEKDGGVSDLTIKLPRSFSSLHNDPLVELDNIVDVWAVDGEGRGMGPNMCPDPFGNKGFWNLSAGWSYSTAVGPAGEPGFRYTSTGSAPSQCVSNPITLPPERSDPNRTIRRAVPLVLTCFAKGGASKALIEIVSYAADGSLIEVSDQYVSTVGPDWQRIQLDYIPPWNTYNIRIRFKNDGAATVNITNFELLAKEFKVYGGEIDEFKSVVEGSSEYIEVQCIGFISYLSDDYCDFLQFATTQQQRDLDEGRQGLNRAPTDPALMIKALIDMARKQNPRCKVFYTDSSIQTTGVTDAQYTFRDKTFRDCITDVMTLCPPGWSYFVDADGCFYLRGPQHATTHVLRIGVELQSFSIQRGVRNLKNVIRFKGRQDPRKLEADGQGSINYTAQDTESIARHGRRVLPLSDGSVTDLTTAKIIAEGRLEETNVVELSGSAVVPDRNELRATDSPYLGYNIQSIRPGDYVQVIDPSLVPEAQYWDLMQLDVPPPEEDVNDIDHRLLQEIVPVTSITISTYGVQIALAQRPPSLTGQYAKLVAMQRRQYSE